VLFDTRRFLEPTSVLNSNTLYLAVGDDTVELYGDGRVPGETSTWPSDAQYVVAAKHLLEGLAKPQAD